MFKAFGTPFFCFMFDFVAIDFETADNYIPCSLGLAVVRQSQIVETRSWLIKPICYPYFHFYAQKIHGIHKEDVAFEPEFDELWSEMSPYLESQILVAHNASFDINVLRKTLRHYKLPIPSARYYCSYQIARLTWPESPKYSLDYLCNQIGFEFCHHKADADAEACAKVLLKEAEVLEVQNFTQLKQKLKIRSPKV